MKKKERYIKTEGIKYDSVDDLVDDLVDNNKNKEVVCRLLKEEDKWNLFFKNESEQCDKDNLFDNIKNSYNTMGVWAMFGRKNKEWECIQVAQKSNRNLKRESIGCEIVADLKLMFTPIPEKCLECEDSQLEDRAFYVDVYKRYKCENCQNNEAYKERFQIKRTCSKKTRINISRRFDIYHQISDIYKEIIILCIHRQECNSQKDINKNKSIECKYAKRHQAIYFHDIKYISR